MAFSARKPEETQTVSGVSAGQISPSSPEESEDHGVERQPALGKQISAQTNRPHKGDVGRPGTNEEVFQGSKEKELK